MRIRLHASVLDELLLGADLKSELGLRVEPMLLGEAGRRGARFTDACARCPAGTGSSALRKGRRTTPWRTGCVPAR